MAPILLALLLPCASALTLTPHAVRLPHATPSRTAVVTMEAVQMAEGATTVAIVGGLATILLAGLPVLFLSGKDKQEDASTRAANLEAGLRSEMGDSAFEDSMMEEVAEADLPPTADEGDEPKQRGSI